MVPGLATAVRYLPAGRHAQVGGDWYDAFALPDGGCMLVIGDVAGHDASAAAAMAQVRGMNGGAAPDIEFRIQTRRWYAGGGDSGVQPERIRSLTTT